MVKAHLRVPSQDDTQLEESISLQHGVHEMTGHVYLWTFLGAVASVRI